MSSDQPLRVGSLFSGIGGLDHGLANAGHTHVFFCESDPYRRDVLRARWPGVPVYEDVREVDPSTLGRGLGAVGGDGACVDAQRDGSPSPVEPEHVDLLCGGFPCQDLSVAGRRAGLAGTRSSLFHEFARIADALRPRRLLVENVPGLLSSNGGRDFGIVLGTLADIGYGLGWRILDSRFFGVPQRRRRVFIVGARADGDPARAAERAGQVLAVGQGCDRHLAKGDEEGQGAAHVLEDGTGSRIARSLESLPHGGYRTTDLGVPAFVNVITSKLRKGTGGPAGDEGNHLIPYCAPDEACSFHIGTPSGIGVRRLTPVECERLQALPDGWTDLGNTPDSRRYAALGDAVTATVAEWIGRRLNAAAQSGEATTPTER